MAPCHLSYDTAPRFLMVRHKARRSRLAWPNYVRSVLPCWQQPVLETKRGRSPMAHDHVHHHDHERGSELSETQLRVRALETVLTEKGYVDPAALDAIIEAYETKVGPHNGARVVAKAWSDPAFKRALLADASK